MVIETADFIQVISIIGDESGLRVAVVESIKGGIVAGVSCAVGGILLGPPGLALGGAVGGALAYYSAKDGFKPVSAVIDGNLDEEKRDELAAKVREIASKADANDAQTLLAFVRANADIKAQLVQMLVAFLASKLNLNVVQ